ncbi:MAG: glycogen synthase, partial [Petrimonas sp.]|nr:glycogen synthase [Petrimonas sp.]
KMDFVNLTKLAIDYSDGVVQGSENINKELGKYIIDRKTPYLGYTSDFENNVEKIGEFCDKIDA